MKHIIVIAIALLAASPMSARAGEATAAPAPLTPTQEYRMWSAEIMIERMIVRMDKLTDGCTQFKMRVYLPRLSDACKESMIKLYPALSIIREVAAGGDDVKWAKAIDIVHEFERNTDAPLAVLERAR